MWQKLGYAVWQLTARLLADAGLSRGQDWPDMTFS
jgi:hypothetical protein